MKLFFGIFVIALSIYLGATLVPIYYNNYQFKEAVSTEATLQTYTTKPEADIKTAIFAKAQEMGIPITKDGITVKRSGTVGTGSLLIEAPYTAHVDLPGYPLDLHFDVSSDNKSPF
jgi:hypothetical protein